VVWGDVSQVLITALTLLARSSSTAYHSLRKVAYPGVFVAASMVFLFAVQVLNKPLSPVGGYPCSFASQSRHHAHATPSAHPAHLHILPLSRTRSECEYSRGRHALHHPAPY
jgi:hypothetical protein